MTSPFLEAMGITLMNETFPILNPQAPMAYMAPRAGATFQIASYMMIGSLGAFIWDILDNIYDDYRLVFKREMTFPTFVYFFSRFIVLTAIIIDSAFWSAPLGLKACQSSLIAACILYHVSFSSTTLLFLMRVRAVFNRNKYIVALFTLLWLGVVGGSFAFSFTGVATVVGTTDYCQPGHHGPSFYIAASPITLLINDTCVFIAISWRLLSFSPNRNPRDTGARRSVLRFVLGGNLPALSRALIQDGQIYYLISVMANAFSVIVATLPAVTLGFGHTYVFSAVIMNMMASKVYRHTKLGVFKESQISTTAVETRARFKLSSFTGSSDNKWQGETKGANREWHQKLRSRILLALILASLIVIPVACASICLKRRAKM